MIQQGLGEVWQGCKGAYSQTEVGAVMDVAAAVRRIELIPEQMVETGVLNQVNDGMCRGIMLHYYQPKDVEKAIDKGIEREGTKQG